eukprot:10532693-Karenia_brevis.AAC.1
MALRMASPHGANVETLSWLRLSSTFSRTGTFGMGMCVVSAILIKAKDASYFPMKGCACVEI